MNDDPDKYTNEDKLSLYGLWKQATVGPCKEKEPSRLSVIARAKHDAWKSFGDMTQEVAKNFAIKLIKKVRPEALMGLVDLDLGLGDIP